MIELLVRWICDRIVLENAFRRGGKGRESRQSPCFMQSYARGPKDRSADGAKRKRKCGV